MHHLIKPFIVLLPMLVFLIASAWAEQVERRSAASEIEITQFEQNLEQRLSRDVRAYLNHDFFIIQVEAQLESVDSYELTEEAVRPSDSPAAAPPQTMPQAQFDFRPSQQDIVSQMELDTEDGITQNDIGLTETRDVALPGLPMPEAIFQQDKKKTETAAQAPVIKSMPQLSQPVSVMPATMTKKGERFIRSRIEIGKQSIKVMLDDHVTPEQQVFIRNLIIEKAGLSFIRGDELEILRSPFPGAVVLDEQASDEPETPAEELPKVDPAQQEPEIEQGMVGWFQAYWQYLLIGLLLMMLLVLLLRRQNTAAKQTGSDQPAHDEKFEALVEKLSQREQAVSSNKVQSLHEELINLAATHPALAADLVNDWMTSSGEREIEQAACLHHHLGQALFNSLLVSPLGAERQIALVAKSQQYGESPADNQLGLSEEIYQALVQRQYQQAQVSETPRPFAFLERLNDDQIIFLLDAEDVKVKALVFSQLPADRAAVLLKRLKDDVRSRIALQISQFDKMPVSAFRDIANRLARKAIDVPSFSNVAVDGVDLLVDMLDHMDSAEESTLLASVKRDNPDLFYQIKRVYLSFEDIIHMPELALKNLIREAEREQLALALFDMDDEFKFVIFNAMLERPRAMLQSLIQNISEPDSGAANQAKRVIARQARAMLKAGAFTMPDDDLESDLSL